MAETGVPASYALSLGLSNGDMGYDVTYEEFAGCYEVPARLVRQAMAWFPATPPNRAIMDRRGADRSTYNGSG